jgi:tetratricopeptide (TPR) repeat protein
MFGAVLALAWWAYRPGLSGAFLFDDLGSLPKLGATGPVDNWPTFWRYITSGTADPTGRPLALLTFLIDAQDWPADPYPFKVTNVALHLINGALLAWVLWWLGRIICSPLSRVDGSKEDIPPRLRRHLLPMEGDTSAVRAAAPPPPSAGRATEEGDALFAVNRHGVVIAALFGAGAWLLHPLFVSTTLYVVQREAMLPATFTLIGILGWIASRKALAARRFKRALFGMAVSAWLCTALAVLSKANGALLPLLLLLVEWIVLTRQPMPDGATSRWHKHAVAVFLVVPTGLLVAYLLYLIPGIVHSTPQVRGWTIWQRLLTEPRVLTDYLRLLFMPHARSSGLFNDAFPISTGWLDPITTIPCIVLVLALIGAGFALRRKHPAIALALLFYFAAQLMESGWVPLELYFEHRNYLPAMLLFWPIGIGLSQAGFLRGLRITCAVCVLLGLAWLTLQRSQLWGNGPNQAQVWAAINPDSSRAQTSAALYDLQAGRPRLAAARLRIALREHPDDAQISLNLITAECRMGAVSPDTLKTAESALRVDRAGGQVVFNWFGEALALVEHDACRGIDHTGLQDMLDDASNTSLWRNHVALRINLFHMRGTLALSEQRPKEALRDFDQALAEMPQPGSALRQAASLAAAGYPELGLKHLDYFETLPTSRWHGYAMSRIHAWVLERQGYWPHEIERLRSSLAADTLIKIRNGKPT